MGFGSGEQGGGDRRPAPRALSALAARSLLGAARLSRHEEGRETARGAVSPTNEVALLEARRGRGLAREGEGLPVPGAVQQPGSGETVAAQGGEEGLPSPLAERRGGAPALAALGAAAPPRRLRGPAGPRAIDPLDRSLILLTIAEDEPVRPPAHPRLAQAPPFVPRPLEAVACARRGPQRLSPVRTRRGPATARRGARSLPAPPPAPPPAPAWRCRAAPRDARSESP